MQQTWHALDRYPGAAGIRGSPLWRPWQELRHAHRSLAVLPRGGGALLTLNPGGSLYPGKRALTCSGVSTSCSRPCCSADRRQLSNTLSGTGRDVLMQPVIFSSSCGQRGR
jgi:hypothetical protein